MIKDPQAWENWEKKFKAKEPIDIARNLRLLDSMFESARFFHSLPPSNPLEGLEIKIHLARVINVSKAA